MKYFFDISIDDMQSINKIFNQTDIILDIICYQIKNSILNIINFSI